jgi:hypothetical protein
VNRLPQQTKNAYEKAQGKIRAKQFAFDLLSPRLVGKRQQKRCNGMKPRPKAR